MVVAPPYVIEPAVFFPRPNQDIHAQEWDPRSAQLAKHSVVTLALEDALANQSHLKIFTESLTTVNGMGIRYNQWQ